MKKFSAAALFCQDIRPEKSGTETLVGVLPDNVDVVSIPGIMPQLCLYTRIVLYPPYEHKRIDTVLLSADGKEIARNQITHETLEMVRNDAKGSGAPFATIVARLIRSPMPLEAVGRMVARVEADGEIVECAQLIVRLAKQTPTSPNV